MRKFEVGDVVNWINPLTHGERYDPGPYVVDVIHPANLHGTGYSVRVTKLNGDMVYFYLVEGHVPIEHDWIQENKLRLEPFLTAARKAVTDVNT